MSQFYSSIDFDVSLFHKLMKQKIAEASCINNKINSAVRTTVNKLDKEINNLWNKQIQENKLMKLKYEKD